MQLGRLSLILVLLSPMLVPPRLSPGSERTKPIWPRLTLTRLRLETLLARLKLGLLGLMLSILRLKPVQGRLKLLLGGLYPGSYRLYSLLTRLVHCPTRLVELYK